MGKNNYKIFSGSEVRDARKKINLPPGYVLACLKVANSENSVQAYRANNKNTSKINKTVLVHKIETSQGEEIFNPPKQMSIATKDIFVKGKSDPNEGFIDPKQIKSKTYIKLLNAQTEEEKEKIAITFAKNVKSIKKMLNKGNVTLVDFEFEGVRQTTVGNQNGEPVVADLDGLFSSYKEEKEDPIFHPDMGFITKSEMKSLLKTMFNQAGGENASKNIASHHGAEAHFSGAGQVDFAEGPIWLAVPGFQVILIENNEQLAQVILDLQKAGYKVPINKNWGLQKFFDEYKATDNLVDKIDSTKYTDSNNIDSEVDIIVEYLQQETKLEKSYPNDTDFTHGSLIFLAKEIMENPKIKKLCKKIFMNPEAFKALEDRSNNEYVKPRGLEILINANNKFANPIKKINDMTNNFNEDEKDNENV